MNYTAEIIKLDVLTTFFPALNPPDIYARHLRTQTTPPSPAKPSMRVQLPSLTFGVLHCSPPPKSPPLSLLAGCCQICCSPAAPFPRFPSQISLRSWSLATLICHSFIIFQAQIYKSAFPLSVRIIVISLYGLDSSFLVLCLWAVVYYYFPIWKLISLKPESLPLPCSVQHEAGALSGLDKPFVIQAADNAAAHRPILSSIY